MNYSVTELKLADKLIIWTFDAICKDYEVRCLRNNIYKSIVVKNFDHLVELWRTHPTVHNENGEALKLLESIRYILRNQKRRNTLIGHHNTNQYLFSIYIGMSEKEMLEYLHKNASFS